MSENQDFQSQLVAFVHDTRFEDLPPELVTRTQRHIVDTLGAGLVGASSEVAKDVSTILLAEGAAPVAALWGRGEKTSARNAALLNGIACHALELDDTGGCDHSGAVVIPALLAVLPFCPQPVSGKAFITAVVLGYDIARRVLEACGGYSAHNGAGWHSTSTCGVLGAAAAAGRLLGLDKAQISSALGIAGSLSGGLWAFIHDGSQSKKLHAGRAAEGGVLAALSAQAGITGPAGLFEDHWGGFLKTLAAKTAQPSALVADLGQVWKLMRCSIKPYASCRGTHSAIDATGILLDRLEGAVDEIEQVKVTLSPFLQEMCGDQQISTLAAAQMSIRYAVAARLVYGHAGLDAYGDEQRRCPALLEAIGRVVLEVDPAYSADGEPQVTLVTKNGISLTHRVDIALGAPTYPMSDAQLRDKFMSLATRSISSLQAETLWEQTLALEDVMDMRVIEQLLELSSSAPFI
ncbi:MmgE/PrpD family protein [Rouxiella badensis]|uniref:MmgE/PrpD family protein n=1 Tax=Rouxiella badensis TaxID=1646377 RepID=UPI001B5A789D|nr:MmgE/PrpD family protein [Rouxiella badensis]MCC3701966.1 MmgE/PrpD family protein [Rouxiella badensis]MCC3749015.1 MmgE/PrpD family protein [Rouxiella badensis]